MKPNDKLILLLRHIIESLNSQSKIQFRDVHILKIEHCVCKYFVYKNSGMYKIEIMVLNLNYRTVKELFKCLIFSAFTKLNEMWSHICSTQMCVTCHETFDYMSHPVCLVNI